MTKWTFTILFLLNTWFCNAQKPFSPSEILQKSASENFQEKIYVHIDQTDHLTGEILWFNLYVTDAIQHKLQDISKVAYVEIIDRSNQAVLQTKVSLASGLGNGSFYLPSTLPTGPYLFRAYTNWMKNRGSEFFFQQSITVINTLKSLESNPPQSKSLAENKIIFFPEGGQFVEGISNRVAFKISGGVFSERIGAVVNQVNDTIAKVGKTMFGIGRFTITPAPGERYKLVLSNTLDTIEESLPNSQSDGFSMKLDAQENQIKIIVRGTANKFYATLIAHTRHSIKVAETKNSQDGIIEFLVDAGKLEPGVSSFTIFDGQNQPICERLYFKKPETQPITVSANQTEYNVRRKANITLKSNSVLNGNCSISIYRADSLKDATSIETYLYLTSELGWIDHSEFYFSDDPMASLAADNLMLTHGWRRFNWSETPSNKKIIYLPEVRGHLIQGKILDNTGSPVALKNGYLSSPGKNVRLYTSRSSSDGIIRFQMKNFELGNIIVQADYQRDSLLHLEIENPFSSQISTWHPNDVKLNPSLETSLINRSVSIQVQDIFREDETYFTFAELEQDSIAFYGTPDESYMLDEYTRFPVMEEILREYVRGVWVRRTKNGFRFRVTDKLNNEVFKGNPLVLLDGVPVFDINQIMELDPLKVRKIEVIARKYYVGPVELEGIVSLSTYNGDLAGFKFDPKSITLDYEGLQEKRQFYSPKYENPKARASRIPDQRNLLYWNPSIKITAGKETNLDFFTSDVEGKFFIVLEGLAEDGTPGHAIQSFIVSR